MKQSILFIGNGPNRLIEENNGSSWKYVIDELANNSGYKEFRRGNKPLPIAYEEVLAKGMTSNGLKERELKNEVAKLTLKIRPNWLHESLLKLQIDHILTTNYDYTLTYNISTNQNSSGSPETKYSLLRSYFDLNKRVWYIHGEANEPDSIMLGHDQYIRYSGRIQEYLRPSKSEFPEPDEWNATNAISPLKSGILNFEQLEPTSKGIPRYSWVDLILTRPVHIVGSSLDFSEIIFWWLMTVRSRNKEKNSYPESGSITWWECGQNENDEYYVDRRLVAEALGIKSKFYKCIDQDYSSAYKELINDLRKELSA